MNSSAEVLPRPLWRRLISVLLLFHLAAIFLPPFAFATTRGPGLSSPFAATLMDMVGPYCNALFLNHGYFFFAPNPGASHLLKARVVPDSGESIERTYPDRDRQWPRLLYHRHFMLAESLHVAQMGLEEPPPADAAGRAAWEQRLAAYRRQRESYRRRLKAAFDSDDVELIRVEHRPPTPFEFQVQGIGLRDARLYRQLPEPDAADGEGNS